MVIAVHNLVLLKLPFRATYLNTDLDCDYSLATDEGDNLSISQIITNILEFIGHVSRKPSGMRLLVDDVNDQPTELFRQVIDLAFFYAQITVEDEARWSSDVNAFVADEDEEIPASTLRTATLDLVNAFVNRFSAATIQSIKRLLEEIISGVKRLQAEGAIDWWKGCEACLAHLTNVAEELCNHEGKAKEAQQTSSFDVASAFQEVALPFLHRPGM